MPNDNSCPLTFVGRLWEFARSRGLGFWFDFDKDVVPMISLYWRAGGWTNTINVYPWEGPLNVTIEQRKRRHLLWDGLFALNPDDWAETERMLDELVERLSTTTLPPRSPGHGRAATSRGETGPLAFMNGFKWYAFGPVTVMGGSPTLTFASIREPYRDKVIIEARAGGLEVSIEQRKMILMFKTKPRVAGPYRCACDWAELGPLLDRLLGLAASQHLPAATTEHS